jgi:hypothetical protein
VLSTQGNASRSANANAQNETSRSRRRGGAEQRQPRGGAGYGQRQGATQGATQSSSQRNSIGRQAGASSKSNQIVPINARVSPSLFTVGSNDGGVTQGNASSANANAQNSKHVGSDQTLLVRETGGSWARPADALRVRP